MFSALQPSLLDDLQTPGNHAVQFYEEDDFLCRSVAAHLGEGLAAGSSVVLIATEPHRQGILQRLGATSSPHGEGRVTALDARETLIQFMTGQLPDWQRFETTVGALLDRVSADGPRDVCAYGEMVNLLWADGNPQAALRLEEFWNRLAERRRFSLLCGYDLTQFGEDSRGEGFAGVCRTHSHVFPTEGYAEIEGVDSRRREIASLQQRAQALESEIEHRKAVERQLRQTLRSRDDFLSVAGHELKTPLTPLRLQLQSLIASDVDSHVKERLQKAGRQVDRLTKLIEDILDVSRLAEGQVRIRTERVRLADVARGAILLTAAAAARAGCEVRLRAEEGLFGAWDYARLEQVLANLLTNAIRYGSEKPVELIAERAEGQARLIVRDQGIGISNRDQGRIFERFERAVSSDHFGGLGLGLWIARRIVEAHGGSVRVDSEPGEGATFTVDLPLAAPLPPE